MTIGQKFTGLLAILAISGLAACNGGSRLSGGFSAGGNNKARNNSEFASEQDPEQRRAAAGETKNNLMELFTNNADPNITVQVNKYIWNASLEVLNFLPIQAADPFTGIISTGYGTPPGGGRAYKATIYVQDPALDARSLNISLRTRSGVASADTVRAVEDAILTRARQLRIRDGKL
ncbi:DUF3576 domain-containing protein [Profundibacter sp.]